MSGSVIVNWITYQHAEVYLRVISSVSAWCEGVAVVAHVTYLDLVKSLARLPGKKYAVS